MQRHSEWNPTDRVCPDCIGDPEIQKTILADGRRSRCARCGRLGASITAAELADIVAAVYWQYYEPSEHGSSPEEIIADLLQDDDTGLPEALARILQDEEWRDVADGADPMFDPGLGYQWRESSTYPSELVEAWNEFEESTKFKSRHFNRTAEQFLEEILGAIKELGGERYHLLLEPGQKLFRARAASSEQAAIALSAAGVVALGPPPRELRTVGRMNAPGISTFYAAFTPATCIAELRPWVGSYAVYAAFELTQQLRLLDLPWFARDAYPGSMFSPLYQSRAELARFLRRLNLLVSRPVQQGTDAIVYASTQVLADYLANVAGFDGIVYTSQVAGSSVDTGEESPRRENVALFNGHGILEDTPLDPQGEEQGEFLDRRTPIERRAPALRMVPGSIKIVRITGINIETETAYLMGKGLMTASDLDDEW